MTSEPLVSVCVVTYNHEHYIHDCLMSVVAQSADASLEILVGDDCSTDGTSAVVDGIVAAFPHLVRVVRGGERLGSGSRNCQRLLAQARGRFIAHLDGDDFWLPGKLRRQLAYLDRHPDAAAVYSNAVVVDAADRVRGTFNANMPADFDLGYLLRRGNFLCHGSLLYRAEHKHRFLHLPTPFLDYRFHVELARGGRLGYVDACLVGYRVASATSVCVRNSALVRRLYLDVLAAVGDEGGWQDDLNRAYAQFLAISIWDAVASGQWAAPASMVRRAWREAPGSRGLLAMRSLVSVLRHLRFKAGNFLATAVLRRPLKVYFPR